jgi:hypothetical protein
VETFQIKKITKAEANALQAFYDKAKQLSSEVLPDGQELIDGERMRLVDEIFADLTRELNGRW